MHVLQRDVTAVVEGECGTAVRESAWALVVLDRQRVRIEYFVVGVMEPRLFHSCSNDCNILFVASVNQLFVISLCHKNHRPAGGEVRNEVQCSLQSAEVPAAVCIDSKGVNAAF